MTKKKKKTLFHTESPPLEVDQLFAKLFGKTVDEQAFLAKLMESARAGHLCMRQKEGLFSSLVEEVNAETEWFGALIGKWQERYYLQRNWVIESAVARELHRLMAKNVKPLDCVELDGLYPEQQEAAKQLMRAAVAILTGGPGTGKTHIIGQCIRSFLNALSGSIAVAAPTGKAVRQLKDKLGGRQSERLSIGTIHALLGLKTSEDLLWHQKILAAEVVVVDECSMIDAPLWAALLKAVKSTARLILVGDAQQLPPVEAGTLFADLCTYFVEHCPAGYAPITTSLRAQTPHVLKWADAFRQGRIPSELPCCATLDLSSFIDRFPKPTPHLPPWNALFEQQHQFRILSCVRQGPFGVETVNEAISREMRSLFRGGDHWPIPILITKSDYDLEIFNGDLGFLIKRSGSPYLEASDEVVFSGKKGHRTLPAAALPSFDYAYCLSVHKSQGSEYDEVACLVPPGSEVFGREVLYTALTRARRDVAFFGTRETLEACLERSAKKESGLVERLLRMGSSQAF